MPLRHDFRNRPPEQVRVVVFGATGYIGRFVTRELIQRGYQVVAFSRDRSGIGGRNRREQVVADLAVYGLLHFAFATMKGKSKNLRKTKSKSDLKS